LFIFGKGQPRNSKENNFMTKWFRRNDGQMFEVDEDTAACARMTRDKSFEAVEESNENETESSKPTVEKSDSKSGPGQSGSGKRRGARKSHKADDAAGDKDGAAVGPVVSQDGDSKEGDAGSAEAGSPEAEG
jgi:hypothetical protein